MIHPDDPTAENLTTAELANDLILMRASDVRVEPIRWLWFARIARGGSPTLIEGPPDKGKSTIICDIVARQTRGDVMPGEVPWPGRTVTPGNVVMMLAEDDLGTTVVPRLIAAGADLERVFFVTATRDEKGQVVPFHLTDDGERLARKAREIDAVLIVLDPLVSYLGSRKGRRMDAHSDMDVRQALQPLLELDSAVLAVRHHKKGRGVDPLEAGSGSIAFTALARVVLVALGDPADPERYLLAVAKNNLVRRADRVTLSYTIVPSEHDPSIGRVEWGTASALSAVDILEAHAASESPRRGGDASQAAEEFLEQALANGPVKSVEIEAKAKAQGISRSTLFRVKGPLGVKVWRIGEGWSWSLPRETDGSLETDGIVETDGTLA